MLVAVGRSLKSLQVYFLKRHNILTREKYMMILTIPT